MKWTDVVTALMAVYAAVIATYTYVLVRRQAAEDAAKLRVNVDTPNIVGGDDLDYTFKVTLFNAGRRPVRIQTVRLEFPSRDGDWATIVALHNHERDGFITLAESVKRVLTTNVREHVKYQEHEHDSRGRAIVEETNGRRQVVPFRWFAFELREYELQEGQLAQKVTRLPKKSLSDPTY